MLSTKKRLFVVMFIGIEGLVALLTIVGGRLLNVSTNPLDPLFFDRTTMSAEYDYNNGTQVDSLLVSVKSADIAANRTTVKASYAGVDQEFEVTPNGFYISGGITTKYQTLFWIHIIEGVGSELIDLPGRSYDIVDPIGILGPAGGTYIINLTTYTNYWALAPRIHGAQASVVFDIYTPGGVLVADGLIDRTCGLLWKLHASAGGVLHTLEITDTTYDISRNRLTGWIWVLVFAVALPVLCYVMLAKVPKVKVDDKTERIEVTMLVACGMAAFVVDVFIDVWMYATLGGLAGNLVAHAIVFAGFVAACAWKRYGYKWLWPAILEFGFVGGMYFADPATYVPYLTAFMGLTISWLFMVIGSGYGPQETRGKLDKVISQIL